jgi:hypothetical protein
MFDKVINKWSVGLSGRLNDTLQAITNAHGTLAESEIARNLATTRSLLRQPFSTCVTG